MTYEITQIKFYVRETKPARFPSALGKAARSDQPPQHVTSPLCHVRLTIRDDQGNERFGCAADRLSVRWLDKRAGRNSGQKRRELAALIERAGELYTKQPRFETPFDKWLGVYPEITRAGRKSGQEALTASFARAIIERAILDGVCRLAGKSLFEMLKSDELGFRPAVLHSELKQLSFPNLLPSFPVTKINIRHTVGIFDPLTEEDWPAAKRLDDGLPETLSDYIAKDGIRFFKVKISGDADADLKRLSRLWEILPYEREPGITLDANEAFEDLEAFASFVKRLERANLGLFQHILYIEQPLPRSLALQDKAKKWIREVSKLKPLIIDESDGSINAYRRALDIGYVGTSHKNCKGFFKSLANLALAAHYSSPDRQTVISAEDLQNLPVVPLQQDFVSVGILGLDHCERNGHHYNFGLSMLSDKDKEQATSRHPDLYVKRGDEWFLRIEDGMVSCASLHGPGFGVQGEPDWNSMEPLRTWLDRRHPA